MKIDTGVWCEIKLILLNYDKIELQMCSTRLKVITCRDTFLGSIVVSVLLQSVTLCHQW